MDWKFSYIGPRLGLYERLRVWIWLRRCEWRVRRELGR